MPRADLRNRRKPALADDPEYDVVVIGAGAAGLSAARSAASFGARVAIVDQNPASGAMPMAHIAALKLRESIRRQQQAVLASSGFLRNKVIREACESAAHAQQTIREQIALDLLRQGVTYIDGAATIANRSVHVAPSAGESRVITAGNIVIATGASFIPPQGVPPDDMDAHDFREVLCAEPLPAVLLILGASPNAVAHASLMAALGVSVTLATADARMLPEMDEEHVVLVQQALRHADVQMLAGVQATIVERFHGRLRATLDDGTVVDADAVHYTSDLLPNTGGLNLLKAGVQVDPAGFIKVDAFFRTTAHGIYAVGNVTGPGSTVEDVIIQGRAAACHIFGRASKEYVDLMPVRHMPGIPELASVGLSEAQCHAQGRACVTGRSNMHRTLRGLVSSNEGHLKLIFDASTRQLIGAHCIGNDAADVVGIAQAVMHYGGTVEAFNALIPIEMGCGHTYQAAARDALRNLMLG
jgi:NAD(P) transhydrogenase